MIVANALVIASGVDDKDSNRQGLSVVEAVFLAVFNVEIYLKLYALGVRRFFKIPWNM